MMSVYACITGKHNIWLVLVAAIVCSAGAWAVIRLFQRANASRGLQRMGWHFLTAVAAGSSIWCTHFIAMLAYEPGVPIGFDPVLTIVSLLVAIAGTALGFIVAASGITRFAPTVGGALVGLAIAAMHYSGMLAYRVNGIVTWDSSYLLGSIVLSVTFSALALHAAVNGNSQKHKLSATGMLVTAIVCLHFTGMTAFHVAAMNVGGQYTNPRALEALALAIAVVGLIIVGTGLASYLLEDLSRSDSFRKMRQMALFDALTGLPNRSSFNDRLDQEIKLAHNTDGKFALIVIDLDKFKEINDVRGHAVGDDVLKIVAKRMSHLLGEGEFVARLGGDEFAAVHHARTHSELLAFLQRLEAALFRPIRLQECEIVAGASMGVALYPEDAIDKQTLVNNADLAMYRAKTDFIKKICFYEPSMDEAVRARRALTSDLREALENNCLEVHYQVQNSISTGEILGYEALVRWKHPVLGNIPPSDFIPLAEESGLILPLGEWVLRTACSVAASWEQPYKVAVNLSPVQFTHANLPKLVHEILIATGLSPRRLELELTESTIIGDKVRSLHILRQIKALGVSISLDDFGTGYSSLETLRTFPFDKIKLDRSFMNQVETSPQAKAIIRAVLALGKSLEVPILAEGIETPHQLAILCAEGCDEGQGYYLGRPAPFDQLDAAITGDGGTRDVESHDGVISKKKRIV